MSLYQVITGRRPDQPLAAGRTVMSTQVLSTWDQAGRYVLAIALISLLPLAAWAQGNASPDLQFGINQSDSKDIITSLYEIWRVVANAALYLGAIVALVGLVFGLGARWVYIAATVAIIGGFGEWALQYILQVGGMELVEHGNAS